ncbi:ribonuclease H [Sesbania bispinosa]|nr:ribonuclease H [Sesbania bispinosa]
MDLRVDRTPVKDYVSAPNPTLEMEAEFEPFNVHPEKSPNPSLNKKEQSKSSWPLTLKKVTVKPRPAVVDKPKVQPANSSIDEKNEQNAGTKKDKERKKNEQDMLWTFWGAPLVHPSGALLMERSQSLPTLLLLIKMNLQPWFRQKICSLIGAWARIFPGLLKDIFRIDHLALIAFLEPRISGECANVVIKKIGLDGNPRIEARGFSGGL